MNIKLTPLESTPPIHSYPGLYRFKLGDSKGLVVLAISENAGIVVGGGTPEKPIGFSHSGWSSFSSDHYWEKIPGSVTLDLPL